MIDKWYDVQDQEGVWRIGQCFFEDKLGTKTISFDGFHPNYTTTFCSHSKKFLPIRQKTYGLTLPQDTKPLRQVLTLSQLDNVSGRLNLYLMKPNYLDFQPKLIKTTIRTQFLIMVDKIMTTPFSIIREIKMLDLEISKFFINLLAFYTRILEFSKTFMSMVESNQTACQLYKSMYELTVVANLIFGIHPHSIKLYQDKLNINLKSPGFIDFFIMSQNGLLPFRSLFKGIIQLTKPNQFDYQLCVLVTTLILDLCEKSKNYLVEGSNQTKTMLVLDQIINCFKHLTQNEELKEKFNSSLSMISRIQSLYFKFRPNKSCPIRKCLKKQQSKQQPLPQRMHIQSLTQTQKPVSQQQFQALQQRMRKLESYLSSNQIQSQPQPKTQYQVPKSQLSFQRPNIPVQNLGEEMFLGSLEWALENGDIQTAKKLTKWRKSLLQVGRITGWEVALAIGARTYKKQQITPMDIIQANYQFLAKAKKN